MRLFNVGAQATTSLYTNYRSSPRKNHNPPSKASDPYDSICSDFADQLLVKTLMLDPVPHHLECSAAIARALQTVAGAQVPTRMQEMPKACTSVASH